MLLDFLNEKPPVACHPAEGLVYQPLSKSTETANTKQEKCSNRKPKHNH